MTNASPAMERRVLVVDDVDDVRHLVAQVLRRQHYGVLEAEGGHAALRRLAREPVDLVVTDVRMPEMGGLELLERVKSLYPHVDVMLLTAYGTIQSAVQAMRNGALDYVTKPFDLRELQDKVAKCFEIREQRQTSPASPLEPLMDLDRVLGSELPLPETLEAITGILRRVFHPTAIEMSVSDGCADDVVARFGNPLVRDGRRLLDGTTMAQLAQSDEPWMRKRLLRAADGTMVAVEALIAPLSHGGQVVGTLVLARDAGSAEFTTADGQLLHVFGLQIALSLLHARARQQVLESLHDDGQPTLATVQTLVEALGMFDAYTQAHSKRVAHFGRMLARELGLDDLLVETIGLGGLLHDIGKLGVGDHALRKNGSLTEDECNRVRQHPANGARILAGVLGLARVVPLVRHHHEAYDGQGYPDGLAGEEIPLGARMLAVVDAYDSMVTDRPYRDALPPAEAIGRLEHSAGTQLDPRLVETWVRLVRSGAVTLDPLSEPA